MNQSHAVSLLLSFSLSLSLSLGIRFLIRFVIKIMLPVSFANRGISTAHRYLFLLHDRTT
jgi:hypothetical protein